MATGGASLRRLLLAAILLSLAICLQEVTAKSGGEAGKKEGEAGKKEGEAGKKEGEADKKEGKADKKEGKADKKEGKADKKEGKADKKEGKADKNVKSSTHSKEGEITPNEDEGSADNVMSDEQTDENNEVRIAEGNETESGGGNSTIITLSCPKECAEWKLEVLALCGTELKGFDNLCYFFQHKCNNPAAGCHFYCCLYPGTDIATASKFDCDDMCRF